MYRLAHSTLSKSEKTRNSTWETKECAGFSLRRIGILAEVAKAEYPSLQGNSSNGQKVILQSEYFLTPHEAA